MNSNLLLFVSFSFILFLNSFLSFNFSQEFIFHTLIGNGYFQALLISVIIYIFGIKYFLNNSHSYSKLLGFLLIFLLGLINIKYNISIELINNLFPAIICFTTVIGIIYFNLNKKEFVNNNSSDKKEKIEINNDNFKTQYPTLSKKFLIGKIVGYFYKQGKLYGTLLFIITTGFLLFGLNHLGQFMSVDEPKWIYNRVPQLYNALFTFDWGLTYINDKPGLLPAFLSGFVNFFLPLSEYRDNPLIFEKFLFWWRFPIVVFNYFMLFFIYNLGKKLMGIKGSIILVSLIAFNPILIGISQIVNPDATLWSTSFISVLAFFLYLKTNIKKYIYISGIFFGLALLSKYFIALYFILYFVFIYLEYIQQLRTKEEFYSRVLDILKIYGIAIGIYFIFFPVNWVNFSQVIYGTIGSEILNSGVKYVFLLIFLIFSELILLKGYLSNFFRNKLFSGKMFLFFLSLTLSSIFGILLFNILNYNVFFDFNNYLIYEFIRGGINYIEDLLASFNTTFLANNILIIIGLFFVPILLLFSKKRQSYNIFFLNCLYLTILIFLLGSSLGGYVADTRYQIMLYPIFAIIFVLILSRFSSSLTGLFIIVFISVAQVVQSAPFYFHFTNILNSSDYRITEAWGYGGYEVAQFLNDIEGIESKTVWADREGTISFVNSHTTWRARDNPLNESSEVDYMVLTPIGEKIYIQSLEKWEQGFDFLYSRTAGTTNILDYYNKEPLYEYLINNNKENWIRVVEIDINDVVVY